MQLELFTEKDYQARRLPARETLMRYVGEMEGRLLKEEGHLDIQHCKLSVGLLEQHERKVVSMFQHRRAKDLEKSIEINVDHLQRVQRLLRNIIHASEEEVYSCVAQMKAVGHL